MSTKAERAALEIERQEYAAELRALLKNVSTIYTITEQPGSTAYVSLVIPQAKRSGAFPYIQRITYSAAKAMGQTLKNGALTYGGYGYSKSFQAVYSLGRALYPDGYRCQGKNCNSNDHTNGKPRDGRSKHSDGGYRFTQSAL